MRMPGQSDFLGVFVNPDLLKGIMKLAVHNVAMKPGSATALDRQREDIDGEQLHCSTLIETRFFVLGRSMLNYNCRQAVGARRTLSINSTYQYKVVPELDYRNRQIRHDCVMIF
jgi:hypothetical protein